MAESPEFSALRRPRFAAHPWGIPLGAAGRLYGPGKKRTHSREARITFGLRSAGSRGSHRGNLLAEREGREALKVDGLYAIRMPPWSALPIA